MLTTNALKNPASMTMVICLLVFTGLYSLFRLPVQLFPDIERPIISIQTGWRAASPREIESEIIEPIEKVLRGTPEMQRMTAFANAGFAQVRLEFGLETDMSQAQLEVISRMNRLGPTTKRRISANYFFGRAR